VLALLMRAVEHPSPGVRMEGISWLTSSFADGTEGTLAKVMDKIEHDPDEQVRRYACTRLAGRQSEQALPLLDKLTRDAEQDPKLYAACFEGLVRLWTGFPNPSKPSRRAYELTLKRLLDKPRSDNRPPWAVMSVFRGIVVAPKNSFHEKWLEQTKGWLSLDAIFAALADVAADPKSHWMARTGAIDTLKKLQAPQATLDRIKAAYEAPKGKDKLVLQKLEQP
jgi:HEAT repeat protein